MHLCIYACVYVCVLLCLHEYVCKLKFEYAYACIGIWISEVYYKSVRDGGGRGPLTSLYEMIRYVRFMYVCDRVRVSRLPNSYGVHPPLLEISIEPCERILEDTGRRLRI